MAKFFEALFNGTTTLDAYTPEVGAAFTAPTVDLFNGAGYFANVGAVVPLSSLEVSGGFLRFPDTLLTKVVALKLGTPSPSVNYAVEIEFDANPVQGTAYFAILMRATTMVVSPWTGANNGFYGELDFGTHPSTQPFLGWVSDGANDSFSTASVGAYADATRTFLLRMEAFQDRVTLYLDGVLIGLGTRADPNFNVPGDVYVVLDMNFTPEATGGYVQLPFRRITGDTTITPLPTGIGGVLYSDSFDGAAAALDVHVPEIGNAYITNPSVNGPPGIDAMFVDGAGNLPTLGNNGTYARSTFADLAGGSHTMEFGFVGSDLGGPTGQCYFFVLTERVMLAHSLVELDLRWTFTNLWFLQLFIYNANNDTLFDSGIVNFIPTGGSQVIACVVGDSGTSVTIDGAEVISAVEKPDIEPDAITIVAQQSGVTGKTAVMQYASFTAGGPTIPEVVFFNTHNTLRPRPFAPGIPR